MVTRGKRDLSIADKLRQWNLEEFFEVIDGKVGCKVCMAHQQCMAHLANGKKPLMATRFREGTFVPEGKTVHWSLVRHLKESRHKAAVKGRAQAEEDTVPDDVSTDAQMYITYDIVKKDPVAGGAPQYEQRCCEVRASGDLRNVPAFRNSKFVFHQNVRSIAQAVKIDLFGELLSKKNPVKFMCWAEDACKQYEQMMVRSVFKDRSEKDILMKWHSHAGKLTSHEKAEAIAEALETFSDKDPGVVAIFKKNCKAFIADGAFAEPLAAVLVKVRQVLPIRYAGRCLMHAKQRNLENSVDTNPELKELLDLLVREYSGGDVWMGGLCRALKNRDRHRDAFSSNVEEELKKVQEALQELGGEGWTGPKKMPTGKHSVSSAPSRFDSLLTALRTIVLNFRAVLVFLVSLRGPWAQRLLTKLQNGETQVQLAALCEYMELVSMYVHKDEGHKASQSSLLTAAGDFLTMGEDLHSMFTGDAQNPPRCTSADYSRGYYQILKKSLASHGEDFSYRSEDGEPLFSWQQQSPEEEATVITNALKKMQHVIEVFEEACKVDLEMALRAAQPIN